MVLFFLIIAIPLESDGTTLGDLSSRIQKAIGRVAVVCDAAHALGASREVGGEKKNVGAIADMTSFSFHAVNVFHTVLRARRCNRLTKKAA